MSGIRIIAGRFGGKMLKAPAGAGTRPTAARVREAWASATGSLLPRGWTGLRVLDAFAGSGALGLEALSRGAAHVTFCECDRRALEALRENCDALDDARQATTVLALDIFARTAVRALRQAGPYDLVILDPPYACPTGRVRTLLRTLAQTGSLNAGALVTYECARDVRADDVRAGTGDVRAGTGKSAGEDARDAGNADAREGKGANTNTNMNAGLDGTVLCAACSPASLKMVSCKTYGTTRMEYLFYR